MQAMGRKIGYIPAAARLADPERELPLQILSGREPLHARAIGRPGERPVETLGPGDRRGERGIRRRRARRGAGLVRPRHVQLQPNDRGAGDRQLSEPRRAGQPKVGRAATCRAPTSGTRWPTPRRSIWKRRIAAGRWRRCWRRAGESGYMATILREPGPIYNVRYDNVPLAEVAGSEREFPASGSRPTAAT